MAGLDWVSLRIFDDVCSCQVEQQPPKDNHPGAAVLSFATLDDMIAFRDELDSLVKLTCERFEH